MLTQTALTFGRGVLLLVLRLQAALPLAATGLPAVQQPQAIGLPAVTLIPHPRLKNATATFAVTSPGREPVGARRTRDGRAMLFLSHGRWCSRWAARGAVLFVPRAPFSEDSSAALVLLC
jgi:hypothetical protein